MGKSRDKKSKKAKANPLKADIEVFARGDYLRARALLSERARDPDLSEGERKEAETRARATRLEPGTLMVGLGCIGLYLLVVLVASLTQP